MSTEGKLSEAEFLRIREEYRETIKNIFKVFGPPDPETYEWMMSDEYIKLRIEAVTTREEHSKSFKNFEAIKRSKKCGCFYCKKIFDASEVDEFTTERDGQKTALCPYCGVDSVIQDSNVEVTAELLAKMKVEWFGEEGDF